MAHVLLPCDLPSWPDVLLCLFQVKTCRDSKQFVQLMTHIHHISCVSLDPEEEDVSQPKLFQELERFIIDEFSEDDRCHFMQQTLPVMASSASRLLYLRPLDGFFYSLCQEDGEFHLDKDMVASLLANAFFSTFPRRSSKTHPTLQDFNFVHFFPHLYKQHHRQKLKAFFRYFDKLKDKGGGHISVKRKIGNGPSLTNWLCCNQSLAPVSVRQNNCQIQGLQVCRTSSMVGGDVLKCSTSEESGLFFKFPELIVILCFVESLSESEVLIVKGIAQDNLEFSFCFSDFVPIQQFGERVFIRELNKVTAALCFEKDSGIYLPTSKEDENTYLRKRSLETKKWSSCKSGSESSERSMKTALRDDESYYTADDDSEDGGCSFRSDSVGFVLGEHERLDDFRKRIRKRTRRLRKRSSYMSSSSDMEDISEAEEVPYYIRVATSEPTLVSSQIGEESPLCQEAEAMILRRHKKKIMMTSSNGRLKAYSYDGVNPNLPVPFKAKFRRRTSPESLVDRNKVVVNDGMGCLRVMILWLAASMSETEISIVCSSEEALFQTTKMCSRIVNKKWTIGDLCSEILQLCRSSSDGINKENIFLEELFRN